MKAVGARIIAKMDPVRDNVNGIALPSKTNLDGVRYGDVISVGDKVTDVSVGDRIGVRHYHTMGSDSAFERDGVTYHVLHDESVLFVE